ncbi:phosphoribosylaminoimidazolesuccinocarboxamide synthase [bacterium]|jgi:phosphoribosylaminoimidazole-succinocarboxamide synthase|nr:phosphoribosylaminoimidazolesuccinocarboxamide synthase [bacterium]
MDNDPLTEDQALDLVYNYLTTEGRVSTTQEILDSGAVPELKGFTVRPGKVSDSIFGGRAQFTGKDGATVDVDNPPLVTQDGRPMRIMVRTQRISTHDINRGEIPFKDQILAANHNYMRRLVEPAIGTSQFDVPGLADNDVVIAAENLQVIPVENIFRAYMAKSSTSTSLYQAWKRGDKTFAGHVMPEGLVVNGPLPYVMDTPSTKSEEHDVTLSPDDLMRLGYVTEAQYTALRNGGLVAFGMAAQFLRTKGIILVDTKFEHGINAQGKIVSQDELLTMDSSRFWLASDYASQMERFNLGEADELDPKSYSKEFARGFSEGEKGYTDEQRIVIATRYILGIQELLGRRFEPDMRPRDERVVSGLRTVMENLAAR